MVVVYHPSWMDEMEESFFFLQQEEEEDSKQLRPGEMMQPHCWRKVMIDLVVEIPFWGW
jgi:hypothetical protein